MAYTATDLANVNNAIAGGTTRVTIDGKTVEYRSLDELLRIRALIEADIGTVVTVTTRRAAYGKGL